MMSGVRFDLTAALPRLPVFPIAQAVLFPRAHLALHIFEERYRKMLADSVASHGVIAISFVKDLADLSDDRGEPRFCEMAGVGYIAEHDSMPDGRSNIMLAGIERVRLSEIPSNEPYRCAEAKIVSSLDIRVTDNDYSALVAASTAFISEIKKRSQAFTFEAPNREESAGTFADLCAHHLVMSMDVRQQALEELNPAARVALVTRELGLQRANMSPPKRESLN